MKNKDRLFLIALVVVIFLLGILSIVLESTIFIKIEKSISLPILLFSAINIIVSISEQIIGICNLKIEHIKGKSDIWSYYKQLNVDQLKQYSSGTTSVKNSNDEVDEFIVIKRENIQMAEEEVKKYDSCIFNYNEIIRKIQNNKVIQVLYVSSLVLLFGSMILGDLVRNFLSFLPSSTITLFSLFLILIDLTFREILANKILEKMLKKEKEKSEASNGQAENGNP